MTLLWILPAVVALVGTMLLVGVARRVADEATGLNRELARFSELRPALIAVRDITAETALTARQLRSSYRSSPR